MKHLLLGTSALITAMTMGVVGASASDMSLKVHAAVDSKIAVVDSDAVGRDDSPTISTESTIGFLGSTTLDNGIEFGLDITIENHGNTLGVNRQIGFANTAVGRFEVGDGEGAVQRLGVQLPDVGSRTMLEGRYAEFSGNKTVGQGLHTGTGEAYDNMDTAARVTYFSPTFNGLQFGASYTPDWEDRGSVNAQSENGYEMGAEAALLFSNSVLNSVDYSFGLTATSLEAGDNLKAAGADDVLAYSAGMSIGYQGVTLGAGYTDLGDYNRTDGNDTTELGFGLGYASGPFSVALNYALTQVDDSADTEWNTYGAGVGYDIGPGVRVTGEVIRYDYSGATGMDGTVGMVGTKISF